MRERRDELAADYEAVLETPVDSLGFLSPSEESDLVALVEFVKLVGRLEGRAGDLRAAL
jgi:hypothetical protein